MVEVKLDIPEWESYARDHYLSVRVGDVQKLSRISAHRTFRIPASAVGNRRYAKVEVFRRVGGSSICIDTQVASEANEAAVEFEGKELQYNVSVSPLKGEAKVAPMPLDAKALEEKSNPKLMEAKDYLERYHIEARLSEAMQALIRARPADPALFLAQQIANSAGVLDKLPRKQDPVKEELERLRSLFPGCSLDGGASSSSTDLYPRAWVKAPALSAAAANGLRINVAQFNVLADGLSGMCHKQGGFTDVPVESLAWRYRRNRLVEELFRHGVVPDVITMQEVDHFYDWFQPILEGLGYEGRFLAKPNSSCRKSLDNLLEDGCAIFWKTEAMSMRHLETIQFGAAAGQPGNQVALVAELRPRDGTHPFVLATTHLSAKKTMEGEGMRVQQASELMECLRSKCLPCILGMDMNAAPGRNSCANYESEAYPTVLRHSVGLRSAYAAALGAEPSYTTWKRRGDAEAKHTIDYILMSGSIAVERVLAPPADRDMAPERMPGWRYPSDHVALLAELRLPKEPLSMPVTTYVQQHMRACKPEAMKSIYSKFPPNHSAKAAAAAREVRMQPPLLPFGQYHRGNMKGLGPELLATMHDRFPASRRGAELRISGTQVLTGAMPHFGTYYSKFMLCRSSGLEAFHERNRQRAVEQAAKKIPAPLLNLSFWLYYKRHCLPKSDTALTNIHAKFRKKPKPRPVRKPEPLVSLSYFLYYNRYMLPSSTVSLTDIHRKFGRGHLEPKVPAEPSSPTFAGSRGAQALLAPTSPAGAHSLRAVQEPPSPAPVVQAPAEPERVTPGDAVSSTAPTASPCSDDQSPAQEEPVSDAPPETTEEQAFQKAPPPAPEEKEEEVDEPQAPAEEAPLVLAPEEEGAEPPVAPEEAAQKDVPPEVEEPCCAPAEAPSSDDPVAFQDGPLQPPVAAPEEEGAEAAEKALPLAPAERDGANEGEGGEGAPEAAPAEVAETVPAPLEEGTEPPVAPEEALGTKPSEQGLEEPPLSPDPDGEGTPGIAPYVPHVMREVYKHSLDADSTPADAAAQPLAELAEESPAAEPLAAAPPADLEAESVAEKAVPEQPLDAPAEEPAAVEPPVAVAAEPTTADPVEAETAATEPAAPEPGATEPAGAESAVAEPVVEESAAPEQPPRPTFQYRLEEREPTFGPYYSEHVLQPYGPGDGFAALHALFGDRSG